MRAVISRQMISGVPPAAGETMKRIGRSGQVCAASGVIEENVQASKSAKRANMFMTRARLSRTKTYNVTPRPSRERAVSLRRGARAVAEPALDVVDHQILEIGGERRSAQGRRLLAVDEHRRGRLLPGPGQRNADVGVLRFARSIDDAAHDRNVETLNSRITGLPRRHLVANEILNLAREFLKRGGGGAPAARTRGDQRNKHAKAHGLQQFLGDLHLERAIAVGLRRQ